MAVRKQFLAAAGSAIAVIGCISIAMNNHPRSSEATAQPVSPRRVSVSLLQPAEKITGLNVPKGLADQIDTYLRVQEPAELTVFLPEDRTIRMHVKYASINVQYGTVVDVHILPLSDAVSFREAVVEVQRLLADLNITPDELMRKQMATWPQVSGPMTYTTGVKLSESIKFTVDLRSSDDNRWFIALMFSAIGEKRDAIWKSRLK